MWTLLKHCLPNNCTQRWERLEHSLIHKDFVRRYECKLCMQRPIRVVFLPCGHALSCEVCCQDLKTCPICSSRLEDCTFVQWVH